MAFAATILYFGSLLLHELAHALQARREGMQVSGITLWVLGGVARFSGSFPSAGAEFRVAFAGPLVTLLLGVAFVAAARLLRLPAAVDAVLSWLGLMNLFLFAFNMLPAVPLDGGRVLHAGLWKLRGSLSWATQVAGRMGQLLGVLMIVGGVLLALYDDFASGLWLMLIGWFVAAGASAETETSTSREALSGLYVSDAMVRRPVTVRSDQTLREVVEDVFGATPHAAYPVADNGRAIGLLPAAGVASLPARALEELHVRDRMVAVEKALTLGDDDELPDAVAALLQTDVRRALVVHGAELVGLLSLTDIRRLVGRRGGGVGRTA
jgi:Zn-dependent protease